MAGMFFGFYYEHSEYEKALKSEKYQSSVFMRSYKNAKRKCSC